MSRLEIFAIAIPFLIAGLALFVLVRLFRDDTARRRRRRPW